MSVSSFRFHFERSLQAAGFLLNRANNQEMKYIHLLKMLYIADREYLAERGYPLTGDKVVAMQHGPVLSRILDLIKGETSRSEAWHRFIQTLPKSHKVRLVSNPGTDDLSKASMAKLDSIFERFGNLQPFEVVQLTHEFPEWQKHYRGFSRTTIPWQAILHAQDASDMERFVEEQINLHDHVDALQETHR